MLPGPECPYCEDDMTDTGGLSQLGQKVGLPVRPEDAEIECIPWEGSLMCCRFTAPEFTSLCPITAQPDFARLVIDYIPHELLIESKSLKLFLGSFRNEGAFHERVIDGIATRLFEAATPHWMRVIALFYARGGIPIDVFWQSGTPPDGVFIPEVDLSPYRGR